MFYDHIERTDESPERKKERESTDRWGIAFLSMMFGTPIVVFFILYGLPLDPSLKINPTLAQSVAMIVIECVLAAAVIVLMILATKLRRETQRLEKEAESLRVLADRYLLIRSGLTEATIYTEMETGIGVFPEVVRGEDLDKFVDKLKPN